MDIIYLKDNQNFYLEAKNKRNNFLCFVYEINFFIKIIDLCLIGFFLLFSYWTSFQRFNKKIIYFFHFDNLLNILIYLMKKKMNLNFLYLQLCLFLIIFTLDKINICTIEENIDPVIDPVESAPPSIQPESPISPILENEDPIIQDNIESDMWGSIYNEGYNFENAYENNGYNNNCYSNNAYDDKEGL